MTSVFISGSIIVFSLIIGVPLSTNAEPIKVMDEASSDSSFIVAQTTNGMDRRQDRRGGRAPGGVNHGPCGER